MALAFYYASGSPYAWRVWLALEHKGIPYERKTLSFDAGDLKTPEFAALNPRRKVPVIVDEGFALYESGAIVEYLEDKRPGEPRLFSADLRQRALQRRMVREADQYFAAPMERLVEAVLFTPPGAGPRSGLRPPAPTRTVSSRSGRRRSPASIWPARCPPRISRCIPMLRWCCAWASEDLIW